MEEQAPSDTSSTAAERRRLLAVFRTIGGAVAPKPGSPPSLSAVIAGECIEEALAQFCARREAAEGLTEGDLRVLALALLHQAEHLTIGCDECAPRAQVNKIVTLAQRAQQLAALYRAEQRLLLQDDER